MVELETKRLMISEITLDDLEQIHKKNSIIEVEEFNTIGIPKNFKQTKEVYTPVLEDKLNDERTKFGWTIKDKETMQFIGETHYSLLPKYWGKGYATEAVKKIINYGFKTLNLHRIEAGVATENDKSIKLLERLGMTNEGIRRKILPIRGEWKDNFHFAILKEDKRNF